jgi:hypothetical protein
MKSKIIETPKVEAEKPFPKLMVNDFGEVVVLFQEHGYWVPLSGRTDIGKYSGGWAMEVFRDFNKSIQLSND